MENISSGDTAAGQGLWHFLQFKLSALASCPLGKRHPATHCSAGLYLKCARHGTVKMVPLLPHPVPSSYPQSWLLGDSRNSLFSTQRGDV